MIATGLLLLAALKLVEANQDLISVVQQSCNGIRIDFAKAMDGNFADNWIGIFSTDNLGDSESLPSGEMWTWLCGSQDCSPQTNPPAGSVLFNDDSKGWLQASWPLRAGTYHAVLTRGRSDENWPPLAISEPFEVDCGETANDSAPAAGAEMASVIMDARRDIQRLIASNPLLVGKFLRLAFHDCVGGCDGTFEALGFSIVLFGNAGRLTYLRHF